MPELPTKINSLHKDLHEPMLRTSEGADKSFFETTEAVERPGPVKSRLASIKKLCAFHLARLFGEMNRAVPLSTKLFKKLCSSKLSNTYHAIS